MDALEKRLKELESQEGREELPPQGDNQKQRKKQGKGVMWELLMIGLKIAGILLVMAVVFTFVFGIAKDTDISMYPAVKDGDLIVYYRLDKSYVKDDTIVVKYNGELQTRRVMAIAGDEVDITEDGLFINGSLQAEEEIHQETKRYDTGVNFPLKVGKGEVFVLGDGRENATDSRVYGCVSEKDSLGKVMMVIRTRGI